MATAASVGDTGAVSDASRQVPAGSRVASAPKSQRVGLADSTSTAPAALPSRPGNTARSPALPVTPVDSSQPRRGALCSLSHLRHDDCPTICMGNEEDDRSTKGSAMDMLTNL